MSWLGSKLGLDWIGTKEYDLTIEEYAAVGYSVVGSCHIKLGDKTKP